MKANDSKECRNCHNYEYMDYAEQGRRGATAHPVAFGLGKTCIDCHKGIAHALPPLDQHIGAHNIGAAEISHGEPAALPVSAQAAPHVPAASRP
jgi:cytochrome c-type protein NapC